MKTSGYPGLYSMKTLSPRQSLHHLHTPDSLFDGTGIVPVPQEILYGRIDHGLLDVVQGWKLKMFGRIRSHEMDLRSEKRKSDRSFTPIDCTTIHLIRFSYVEGPCPSKL